MMRNIERFPSKQMYTYLSLAERKVAEFYHNWFGQNDLFSSLFRTFDGVLTIKS